MRKFESVYTKKGDSIRRFESGAIRDTDDGKFDYEAFLSPAVIERYAEYMHKHRQLADGSLRDGDDWQAGIPKPVYMKSAWRHFLSWWKAHRGYETKETIEESLCALIFNASGYLFELIKEKNEPPIG